MSLCQKCWDAAYFRVAGDTSKSQYEHYLDLITEFLDSPTITSAHAQYDHVQPIEVKNERIDNPGSDTDSA